MRARTLVPVVLLVAVALVVVTGACLVHADDGPPDLCSSLVAVTLGLPFTLSLGRSRQILFARLDGYHPPRSIRPLPLPRANEAPPQTQKAC
jgi:hypothetical protein